MNDFSRALGRFFQINAEELKRHVVTTWRCKQRGHVLGYTVIQDGNLGLIAQTNEKATGANLVPIPARPAREGLTVERVQGWSLSEFSHAFDAGEVTSEELDYLYRAGLKGKPARVSLFAYLEEADLQEWSADENGYPEKVRGVDVRCECAGGIISDLPLRQLEKKVIVDLRADDVIRQPVLVPVGHRVDGHGIMPQTLKLNLPSELTEIPSRLDTSCQGI